jgi:hypothetical protein
LDQHHWVLESDPEEVKGEVLGDQDALGCPVRRLGAVPTLDAMVASRHRCQDPIAQEHDLNHLYSSCLEKGPDILGISQVKLKRRIKSAHYGLKLLICKNVKLRLD